MFYLNYNYADAKLAQKAIKCVLSCKTTGGKDFRVRDIIELKCPGLYKKLSRGDKCRIGMEISKLFNLGMIPKLKRGKKKGSTNTYHS